MSCRTLHTEAFAASSDLRPKVIERVNGIRFNLADNITDSQVQINLVRKQLPFHQGML